MKSFVVRAPGGLDRLTPIEQRDPGLPGPGELRVRLHATSLNFHDLLVVTGQFPAADGRVPMSDGAGIVEEIGSGVAGFAVGDAVVSCFFPDWQDGAAAIGDFQGTPGDGVDGFAQSFVVRPAQAFTQAPTGWSHAEAATITTAGLTAWRALIGDGKLSGVLATGGDLIFNGDPKGYVHAYDDATGQELWKFQTGSGIRAGIISYAVNGHQYIAVPSGWGSLAPGFMASVFPEVAKLPGGAAMVVFSLD